MSPPDTFDNLWKAALKEPVLDEVLFKKIAALMPIVLDDFPEDTERQGWIDDHFKSLEFLTPSSTTRDRLEMLLADQVSPNEYPPDGKLEELVHEFMEVWNN